jgi:hypothetical protein
VEGRSRKPKAISLSLPEPPFAFYLLPSTSTPGFPHIPTAGFTDEGGNTLDKFIIWEGREGILLYLNMQRMVRIFTLNFSFREQVCTALVSLRTIGYGLSCQVKYMDQHIHQIVPGGSLIFHLSGEVKSGAGLDDDPARELLSCTTEAICGYLKE